MLVEHTIHPVGTFPVHRKASPNRLKSCSRRLFHREVYSIIVIEGQERQDDPFDKNDPEKRSLMNFFLCSLFVYAVTEEQYDLFYPIVSRKGDSNEYSFTI